MTVPFRWDLVTPDQLGSLLCADCSPDLWFLDDLVDCAGKVLARSGNGDLVFVGRSLDSMFDLLGGALPGHGLFRLPFSFPRHQTLHPAELAQARRVLTDLGLSPQDLARRSHPVTFVDVAYSGSTFTELFTLLDDSIAETKEPWNAIRLKLRFVGVTWRGKTSPNTFRWQQHAPWTSRLPAASVVNVSLNGRAWSYFGNDQIKLTRSFKPDRWLAEADEPDRGERTRHALSEAVALVSYGRSPSGRHALARAIDGEPALSQPWLRTLVGQLNRA